MKKLLTICAALVIAGHAHAQTESDAFYSKRNNVTNGDENAQAMKTSEFDHAQIAVEKGIVTITGLPDETKPIWAMVSTAEGEAVKGVKVSAAKNTIDLHHEISGMYFVTLVYKNASKKAFVIHL